MLMSNQHHTLYSLHDYYCFVVYGYKRSCFEGGCLFTELGFGVGFGVGFSS